MRHSYFLREQHYFFGKAVEKYDLVSQNVLVAKFPEYFYCLNHSFVILIKKGSNTLCCTPKTDLT